MQGLPVRCMDRQKAMVAVNLSLADQKRDLGNLRIGSFNKRICVFGSFGFGSVAFRSR